MASHTARHTKIPRLDTNREAVARAHLGQLTYHPYYGADGGRLERLIVSPPKNLMERIAVEQSLQALGFDITKNTDDAEVTASDDTARKPVSSHDGQLYFSLGGAYKDCWITAFPIPCSTR
jgi:hypothetical protein